MNYKRIIIMAILVVFYSWATYWVLSYFINKIPHEFQIGLVPLIYLWVIYKAYKQTENI